MAQYPEYKGLNLPEIDKTILSFWKENGIFEQSVTSREGRAPFVFYEGPPSANGMPGIHHVLSRTIKDMFCRFKTLQGYQVKRKAGWDTHGLPVELQVEKMLGITKENIGKDISVEEYNRKCREEVMRFKDAWDELTDKMGYWVDLEDPYITYDNKYIESLWWLLKRLYDKNLLYEGFTIQPYSPAAGTGLSTHELNLPGAYRMVRDLSLVAQFKVAKEDVNKLLASADADVYFLAWTTTPWTLPSNTALAVGENIEYTVVETVNPYTAQHQYVVLAKDLLGKYFKPEGEGADFTTFKANDKILPYKIVNTLKGKQLEGLHYEQLMPYVKPDGKAFEVVVGDFVSTEDGTGIVHIAPTFGSDDFRVAKKYGIVPMMVPGKDGKPMPLVDQRGRFVPEVTDYAGEYVKEDYLTADEKEAERIKQGRDKYLSVDARISIKLKEENKCFKTESYEHNYPHCWRTDKPILYYPLDSWFIKTTACKDRMVELNKTINWKPEFTGSGRFGNWLENLQDWNLSRSRYWGTPLPLWLSEDKTEVKCIGSIEELTQEYEKATVAGLNKDTQLKIKDGVLQIDLHKPFVDVIELLSPTGKTMRRVADLVDVWFDSGAMPYAQLHYPFENKELIDERKYYPADFIAEGVDQTRGWFFTLHAIGTMLFDSVAFKNVVSNGLVLDKNGNKMSKRLGNAVEPFETIAKHGADAVRWYMISNSQPWDNLKFDLEGIEEVKRKFFGTLYNTYAFYALYANVDGFVLDEENITPVEERSESDRWIISKLHSLIKEVTDYYIAYEPTQAARAIETFVDEHLSNWYVRLNRRRFWKGEMSDDKKAAYETLHECFVALAQLISPVAPFFAEWLYKNMTDGIRQDAKDNESPLQYDSVHLTYLAQNEVSYIDEELEAQMQLAQDISSLVLSLRKKATIKVRQPLQRILIPVLNDTTKTRIERVRDIIRAEVNVKEIEYVHDTSGLVSKKVKPDFKKLGAKLGKKMKAANELLQNLEQVVIAELELNQKIILNVEGDRVEINLDEVEIVSNDIEGWTVANKNGLIVALDVHLTPILIQEGIARELVNRIQNIRKERIFNITDRISISIENKDFIADSLIEFKNYICNEVLADDIVLTGNLAGAVEVEINEIPIKISINKN